MHTETKPPTKSTEQAQAELHAFRAHYGYDVTYLEELLAASPEVFHAFEQATTAIRVQKHAPIELIMVARLTAVRVEDCGPCTALGMKMAREAGVPDALIQGVLRQGEGLPPEALDVHHYARAVAANEAMDPELLPRLQARWGHAAVAELALAIVGVRLYPTMRRALGHGQSCSLTPGLTA